MCTLTSHYDFHRYPARSTSPTIHSMIELIERRDAEGTFLASPCISKRDASLGRSGCKKSRRNLAEDRVWIGARENPRRENSGSLSRLDSRHSPRCSVFIGSLAGFWYAIHEHRPIPGHPGLPTRPTALTRST